MSEQPLSLADVLWAECEHIALGRNLPPPGPKPAQDEDDPDKIFRELPDQERWALCLSGGGIRSATFALGVLQGLAQCGLLKRFDYLSTVSGGGYVGGWLTGWIQRHKDGLDGVVRGLVQSLQGKQEPGPIRHLRDYSNYLSPKLGALSADTWTLIATYLRNLTLHWLVFLPLILVLLLTPKIGLQLVRAEDPGWPVFLLGLLILGAAIADLMLHRQGNERHGGRRPWPRFGLLAILSALLLAYAAAWLLPAISPSWWAAFAQQLSLEHVGWIAVLLSGGLLTVSTVYLGLNRPSSGRLRYGQGSFLAFFLAPIMLSALLLTLAWSWLATSDVRWWWLIPVGMLLRAFSVFIAHRSRSRAAGALPHTQGTGSIRKGDRIVEIVVAAGTGALGGALLWIISGWIDPSESPERAILFACFIPPLIVGTFLISETIFVGLASFWTEDEDREWWGRSAAWLLIGGLSWMLFRILVLLGPAALAGLGAAWGSVAAAGGGLAGVLAASLGFAGKAADLKQTVEKVRGPVTMRDIALGVLAPIFIVALLALLSFAIDYTLAGGIGRTSGEQISVSGSIGMGELLLAGLVLSAIGLVMSWCVNINKFSLHAMYRYRLIRAYLGASNLRRDPHPFTGFDPADNIQMTDIWPNPSAPDLSADPASGRTATGGKRQPLHVINIALNLVSGKKLAWQQRKAAPFTVTSLHCGSKDLGYRALYSDDPKLKHRPARLYGGQKEGISLGTAVTISGAAASPNMGYHSSAVVTFIMALFNARLGWWLGNPGPKGHKTFDQSGPKFAIRPLVAETFGLTDDQNPYVYLSDGGHFENLGLYEMVLRRCRLIVVSDAGCDPTFAFQDLGNAIRKVRIDLGVEIVMDEMPMRPRGNGTLFSEGERPGRCCAVGRIIYPAAENAPDGVLIYLKPGLYGGEPVDVLNYARQNPSFPHEPTSDQWFSEAQFESYRALGAHVAETVFGREPLSPTAADVESRARGYAYGEGRA
jgi:hypothetical protein